MACTIIGFTIVNNDRNDSAILIYYHHDGAIVIYNHNDGAIVIYNHNDSAIVIYNPNSNGQYYKITIIRVDYN